MLRLFLLLIATPALAQTAHSGATATRSMPELSDIALFALAALSIWFVRRAMRARFRKADAQD
jgi:hypothetical protein